MTYDVSEGGAETKERTGLEVPWKTEDGVLKKVVGRLMECALAEVEGRRMVFALVGVLGRQMLLALVYVLGRPMLLASGDDRDWSFL